MDRQKLLDVSECDLKAAPKKVSKNSGGTACRVHSGIKHSTLNRHFAFLLIEDDVFQKPKFKRHFKAGSNINEDFNYHIFYCCAAQRFWTASQH